MSAGYYFASIAAFVAAIMFFAAGFGWRRLAATVAVALFAAGALAILFGWATLAVFASPSKGGGNEWSGLGILGLSMMLGLTIFCVTAVGIPAAAVYKRPETLRRTTRSWILLFLGILIVAVGAGASLLNQPRQASNHDLVHKFKQNPFDKRVKDEVLSRRTAVVPRCSPNCTICNNRG